MPTTFHQSSTLRSTMGRSVFDLFQMTTYLPPDSCPYCDEDFSLYPLAFMQLSKTCCLLSPAKVASRAHWYKSRS
jgi:hypothetical protein